MDAGPPRKQKRDPPQNINGVQVIKDPIYSPAMNAPPPPRRLGPFGAFRLPGLPREGERTSGAVDAIAAADRVDDADAPSSSYAWWKEGK